VTNELMEEVDMGLDIIRSLFRIGGVCMRMLLNPPFSLIYAIGDHGSPANSVAVMQSKQYDQTQRYNACTHLLSLVATVV